MARRLATLALASLFVSAVGCAAAPGDEGPVTEAPAPAEEGVAPAAKPLTPCTEMFILCAPGYEPKTVGRCRQICVPICTPKCGAGEHCAECKTVGGSSMVCLPDGATC